MEVGSARSYWYITFTAAGLVATVAAVAAAWLFSNATQAVPRAVAVEFLHRLHAGQFEEARELAAESPFFGASADDLARVARRQLCATAGKPVSTHPPQTTGNRLRRWLSRVEVELPEVSVEFIGQCPLRVTLRHQRSGEWRVYRLVRHAG